MAADPNGNFRADVACYAAADPMPALENLSRLTGVPLDLLIRYVLVKYAASASDAVLAMRPVVFGQMQENIRRAEAEGSPEAKLQAYEALKAIIGWLAMPADV